MHSLLARRHLSLQPDLYGEIFHWGSASNPTTDGGLNSTSPTVIVPPSGMIAGDLVTLWATVRDDDNTPITISETGGQSWSISQTQTSAGGDGYGVRVFWCKFNGTWSANPSVAFVTGTAGRPRSAVMHVFRSNSPHFSDWGFEGNGTLSADNSSPIVLPGRTVTHESTISVAIWYTSQTGTWNSLVGSGWVHLGLTQYRNLTGLDTGTTYAIKVMRNVQATGNVQKNFSGAAVHGFCFQSTWYQIIV